MATTRKGWRPLTVEGQRYRWTIKREPKYWDNHSRKHMRFTVESSTGALLVVELNRPRLDYWWPEQGEELRPATPSEVVQQIQAAIRSGWNPATKAKPFFYRAN